MSMSYPRRGDTLVEVTVSFAIFAVVAVSVSVLMNRGLAIGQQSLEIALVREQISSQAEMLRFARYNTADTSVWKDAINADDRLVNGEVASKKLDNCANTPPNTAFVLHPVGDGEQIAVRGFDATSYVSPEVSSLVEEDGTAHGLWVQVANAEDQSSSGLESYDFYIHACWYVPSSDQPQTLTTMVRLYG